MEVLLLQLNILHGTASAHLHPRSVHPRAYQKVSFGDIPHKVCLEDIKNIETGKMKNEFRTKFIQLVFKQRPELSAYGNRGYRYILRI